MSIRKIALVIALCAAAPAMAQLSTLVAAVEASTSVVNVPTSPNGNLSFKPCSARCDSDYIIIRLTADTRFVLQGHAVNFAVFRKNFYNSRRRANGYALVTYDTKRKTTISVVVSF